MSAWGPLPGGARRRPGRSRGGYSRRLFYVSV